MYCGLHPHVFYVYAAQCTLLEKFKNIRKKVNYHEIFNDVGVEKNKNIITISMIYLSLSLHTVHEYSWKLQCFQKISYSLSKYYTTNSFTFLTCIKDWKNEIIICVFLLEGDRGEVVVDANLKGEARVILLLLIWIVHNKESRIVFLNIFSCAIKKCSYTVKQTFQNDDNCLLVFFLSKLCIS